MGSDGDEYFQTDELTSYSIQDYLHALLLMTDLIFATSFGVLIGP